MVINEELWDEVAAAANYLQTTHELPKELAWQIAVWGGLADSMLELSMAAVTGEWEKDEDDSLDQLGGLGDIDG